MIFMGGVMMYVQPHKCLILFIAGTMCVFLSVSPVSCFVEEIADAELNQVYDILIHKTHQAEPGTEVTIDAFVLQVMYINCISFVLNMLLCDTA